MHMCSWRYLFWLSKMYFTGSWRDTVLTQCVHPCKGIRQDGLQRSNGCSTWLMRAAACLLPMFMGASMKERASHQVYLHSF